MIDAFRLTDPRMQAMGHEPRQTTSNLGHLQKPSIQALIHGLGRHYYSLPINYRKNELEQRVRGIYTVEPLNTGHTGDECFVHCSEVVPSSEVEMYIGRG